MVTSKETDPMYTPLFVGDVLDRPTVGAEGPSDVASNLNADEEAELVSPAGSVQTESWDVAPVELGPVYAEGVVQLTVPEKVGF
jgi:hypothetical protein